MDEFVDQFLNIGSLLHIYPLLLEGLGVTVKLILAIVPTAIVAGLVVAVLIDFRIPILRPVLIAYIDFIRAFPPLVMLVFLYSGLPFVGINLGEFGTVVAGLAANGSAFFAEIFRAGINSVSRTQRDAARSTGVGALTTVIYIVLPQAIRNVIPPLASNVLDLAKLTSLGSVVALPELLRSARIAQMTTLNPTPLIAIAVIYLLMLWPLVRLLSLLEIKANLTSPHGATKKVIQNV